MSIPVWTRIRALIWNYKFSQYSTMLLGINGLTVGVYLKIISATPELQNLIDGNFLFLSCVALAFCLVCWVAGESVFSVTAPNDVVLYESPNQMIAAIRPSVVGKAEEWWNEIYDKRVQEWNNNDLSHIRIRTLICALLIFSLILFLLSASFLLVSTLDFLNWIFFHLTG